MSVARMVWAIILADLMLLAAGTAVWAGVMPTYALPELFGLSIENSLPTAYAGLKLSMIALCLGVFALGEEAERGRRGLLLLALLFLFLGIDEVASVHERAQEFVRGKLFEPASIDTRSEGKLHLEGLLLGGGLVALLACLLPFLRGSLRWRSLETPFLAGFALLVLGGVVIDIVPNVLWPNPVWSLSEEMAEFGGATIMLLTALRGFAVHPLVISLDASISARGDVGRRLSEGGLDEPLPAGSRYARQGGLDPQ